MSFYGYVHWRMTTEISVMYGSEKVKFSVRVLFVFYLGERGVLCVGNVWHLCTAVRMNMSNITFEVAWGRTVAFLKSVRKNNIHEYTCDKSLKGYGWNSVDPASQTVAHNYISIGPMYRGSVWYEGSVLSQVKETNGNSLPSIDWVLASTGNSGRNRHWRYILTRLLGSFLNYIMYI